MAAEAGWILGFSLSAVGRERGRHQVQAAGERCSTRSAFTPRKVPPGRPGAAAAAPDLDNSCLMGNVPHKSDAAPPVFIRSLSCGN